MQVDKPEGTIYDGLGGEPIEVRICLTRKDAKLLAGLLPEAKPGDTLKTASFGAKLRGALEMMGFKGR